MKIAVVVPSCREEELAAFLRAWESEFQESGAILYVVEDGESPTFRLPQGLRFPLQHLSWRDAPAGMLDCINVRSPGCRQIGFWKAHVDQCDVIITLDDDVRPAAGTSLVAEFARVLAEGVPAWVDPLLNYRSRGYPVENTGRIALDLHIGSFLGIPDVDAATQLEHGARFASEPPRYQARPLVVPPGQFVPLNGGIAAWRRELVPYVHYALWDGDLRYRRFDDIWMGVILKSVFDLAGRRMGYGPPFAVHFRASDATKNLEYEREGKLWNETFWERLAERVGERREPGECTLDEAFARVAGILGNFDNAWARREAAAMLRWRGFFGGPEIPGKAPAARPE